MTGLRSGPRTGKGRNLVAMLSRRSLMRALALLALFGRRTNDAAFAEEAGQIDDLFLNPDAARALGREYIRKNPHDVAALRQMNDELAAAGTVGRRRLRRHLSKRITEDFETDRVVVVDGWVLARTEARLCALTTLT